MNQENETIKESIIQYCTTLGRDPLLVQGAGGNVSWKEDNTLWIKASGTWLAEASDKNIFVPVNLSHLNECIKKGDFSATPQLNSSSTLRPSIETFLHGLLPHKVVVHLHAIDILAHLVCDDCESTFKSLITESIRWLIVDYYKPGEDLASEVKAKLAEHADTNVIFLKNHGVVIGGDDINTIDAILKAIVGSLSNEIETPKTNVLLMPEINTPNGSQYSPISDPVIHNLATNPNLYDNLINNWALYPDHVVFLGSKPICYSDINDLLASSEINCLSHELVFIKNVGVHTLSSFNAAKLAQLKCYYDVVCRIPKNKNTKALSGLQISELLNWDAEQYRIQLNKSGQSSNASI